MSKNANRSSIVLFDGICNLCNGAVNFIIDRDPHKRFKFASMQSPPGQELLEQQGMPLDKFETFVLIEARGLVTKSTAALRIARGLSGFWPLLYGFMLLPRPIRDALYDFVARHRYQFFGKRNACMLPEEDILDRFLNRLD